MIVYAPTCSRPRGLEAARLSYRRCPRRHRGAATTRPNVRFVAATKIDDILHEPGAGTRLPCQRRLALWDRTGSSRWRMEPTVEVLGFYREHRPSEPGGRALLAAIAPSSISRPRGDDHPGRPSSSERSWRACCDDAPPTINDDPNSSELAGLTGIVTKPSPVPSNPEWRGLGRHPPISASPRRRITEAAQSFVEYCHVGIGTSATLRHRARGQVPGERARRGQPRGPHRGLGAGSTSVWTRRTSMGDLF